MNLARKTLAKLSIQTLSTFILSIFQIISLSVFAKLLEPEDFGIYAIAVLINGIGDLFANAGVATAIVQKKDFSTDHLFGAFVIILLLSSVLYLTIYSLSGFVADFYNESELVLIVRITGITLVILSLSGVPRALLQKKLQFTKLLFIDNTSYFLGNILIGIGLAVYGFGVWALIIAFLTTASIKLLMSLFHTRKDIKFSTSKKAVKELLHFGGGITLARIFNYVGQDLDKFMLGKLLSIEILGLYERISYVAILVSKFFGNILDTVLFPILSGIQNEKKKVTAAFILAGELLNTFLIPLIIVAIFYSREIILVLLDEKWLELNIPFKLLLSAVILRLMIRLSDALVRALGAVYKSAFRKAVFAVSVFFGIFFGVQFGILGATVGIVAAFVIHYLMMVQLALQLLDLKITFFFRLYKSGFILGGITLLVFWVLRNLEHLVSAEYLFAAIFSLVVGVSLIFLSIIQFPQIFEKKILELFVKLSEKGATKNILIYKYRQRLLKYLKID